MDKVKYTLSGSVVNATFTFDDEQIEGVINAIKIAPITVNLNGMTISDGDILAKELNDYGQKYKSDCLARIPSQAVAGAVGMEFGFVDGVIVPIIPEVPEAPEGEPIPGVDDIPVDPETPTE